MQRCTDTQGGRVSRLPGQKRSRGNGKQQAYRKDAAAFGAFGTPVLNQLKTTNLKLKKFVPETLIPLLKNGSEQHLLACGANMAKQYGFKLETKHIRNNKETLKFLEELHSKSGEIIRLYNDTDGILRLGHGTTVTEDWVTYFVPVKPTLDMRPEMKEFAQRAIKTVQKAFKLGDIMETPHFEWTKDNLEVMEDEAKSNPKNFNEEDIEKFKCYHDYTDDGIAQTTLYEIYKMKPLSRKEVESFKPLDDAEEKLRKATSRLMDIADTGLDIWDWRTSKNPFVNDEEDKTDEDEYENTIPFDSLCTVIYDLDLFLDEYLEMLRGEIESGYGAEGLANVEEITENGELTKSKPLVDFMNALCDFINAVQDDKLDISQQKEETVTKQNAA